MTEVVNIHKIRGIRPHFDVYIGRSIKFHNENTIDLKKYWFKDSKWANPNLSLENYEIYIRIKIKNNPDYYNIEDLRGKKLGCWCITTDKIYPIICHGQIILKILFENLKSCYKCSLNGIICSNIHHVGNIAEKCKLYNGRPICNKCGNLLVINKKIDYKYNWCWKCGERKNS